MNCERFRNDWTEWHEGWLEDGAAEMARHRDACAACARYDRQMRRLVEELAALPLPAGEAAAPPAAATPVRARTAAAPRWLALAATLVVGIALGLMLGDRSGNGGTIVAEPVEIGGAAEQRIAIAVQSPRAYDRVEFVVELPEGVELAGFPGQRSVRWEGRLAEGRSLLRLPLRIAPDMENGQLVTRIVRPDGERRLVVPLKDSVDSVALEAVRV